MENFEHLRRTDTVLLSTRRRDGSTVETPVNLAVDDAGFGYFRTWPGTGKVKRLRNFAGVRVARCTRNGHPQGSDQPALASLLTGADAARADALLVERFPVVQGVIVRRLMRLKRRAPVFYRLEPAAEPTPTWDYPPH